MKQRTYEVVVSVTLDEDCDERPDEVAEAVQDAFAVSAAAWHVLESKLSAELQEIDCECTTPPLEATPDA